MEAAILAWLQDVAIRAFGLSLFLVLAIDGAFALVLFAKRDREIVNRWTSRVLAANLVLAGTGVGVPVLALGSRLVVRAVGRCPGPQVCINADKEDDTRRRVVKASRTDIGRGLGLGMLGREPWP
jgi:hypothetical protein